MINTNILKILESTLEDPSYSVVISKFNQTEFCNKDRLEMTVKQYNPNLEEIIENKMNIIDKLKSLLTENNIEIPDLYEEFNINSCVNRTLVIDSVVDVNKNDSLFISRLTGSITNDIEDEIPSKKVKLSNKKGSLEITEKDSPNLFNRLKFRKNDDNLIISIPKKINTITIKDEQINRSSGNIIETFNYSIEDMEDNKIIIPFGDKINIYETITIPAENEEEEDEVVQNLVESIGIYHNVSISYTLKNNLVNQKVESITAPFNKTIELEFTNLYKNLPGIIITVDEDKKKFSGYETRFSQNENNQYNGVKINFKNVKRSKEYSDINITVISTDSD